MFRIWLPWNACPFPPGREPPRKRGLIHTATINPISIEGLKRRKTQVLALFLSSYLFMLADKNLAWVAFLILPHVLSISYLSMTSSHKQRYDGSINDRVPLNLYWIYG